VDASADKVMADNGGILNEAEVDFLLTEEDAAAAATKATATAQQAQTVTMRGDLEQINLADIFQTLAMSKMEGVLRLRNPLEERQIHCRDGVVQILVPNRLGTRRLGQRLIQAGLVQAEQLRTALVEQRKEKLPLGEMVIRSGLVTREQIDEIIGMQVAEDLFALFTWRHGTFEFFKGALATDEERARFAACPEFEVNALLLEVARRSDEWQAILSTLGSLDEVPARIADPAEDSDLDDDHRTLLAGANGQTTYRELAEQTTSGLFEVARAARDLVQGGLLANIDDDAMVGVATTLAQAEEGKRSLVLLQTLRDRPGERTLAVVRAMATALERVGERRLAGALLLESAQKEEDATTAIELARAARQMSPYDPGALSFLRTVLIAHCAADSPELEKCTLDLLDALIDNDLVPTALEIVEDARRTGSARPQILMREARARQKARDPQGAAAVLFELGQLHDAAGDRPRAIEAYEALLKVDRSRKDIQKLLVLRKQTRVGRLVRLAASIAAVLMLGGMAIAWWQQRGFDADIAAAKTEIDDLLQKGDRAAARERWDHWLQQLGGCEPLEDLRNRITFAESTEAGRLQKAFRARVNDQITAAAQALTQGDLEAAFAIYVAMLKEPALEVEILGVVRSRLDAVLTQLEGGVKGLEQRLPPMPSNLLDRRDLLAHQADLWTTCPPAQLKLFWQLSNLVTAGIMPACVDDERRARIEKLVADGRQGFARVRDLAAGYATALDRNDQQRRLDPLFKEAVEREAKLDFAGALTLYRDLAAQEAGEASLRSHFRDKVKRNATIVEGMTNLRTATAAGDFKAAQQLLTELATQFPDIPFDRMVELPLLVTSQPSGATVLRDGKDVGKTPLLLTRQPATPVPLELRLTGFVPVQNTIVGTEFGTWHAGLALPPDLQWQHASAIEVAPAVDGRGRLFVVDRSGAVVAYDAKAERPLWTHRTDDLSGLLTRPLLHGDLVLVASLDGDLRALRATDGSLAWSLPGLPTETAPVLIDGLLALLTTDQRLRVLDLAGRRQTSVELPEAVHTPLLTHGSTLVVIGERGRIRAFALPDLALSWQRDLPNATNPVGCHGSAAIAIGDESGRLFGLELATGELRWQLDLGSELLGPPTIVGDQQLWTTEQRIVRIDPARGVELGAIEQNGQDWTGSARAFGNRLIVPQRDGQLQVLAAGDGELLYRIEGQKRSRALVDSDRLFLVGSDHAVRMFRALR
jgi:outer membrane protein assembly factor BamB/tetratricopeptide (TPR) repeat protein